MADVARLAGVSGQTVSRVVNGSSGVTEDTRERVEGAMKQLGYRANAAARALATGRFRTIGVVTFNLTAVGNIQVVNSVISGAREKDYSTSLAVVETATEQGVRAAVRGLTDRAVDGVIVIEARVLDTPNLELPDEVPVVIADSSPSHSHPTFGMDEAAGARAAVGHLLELGHRTVHHLAGPEGSHPAARRRAAWARMLEREGRVALEPLMGDWSPESGYEAGRRLLEDDAVTAVFAANDQMAAGVLRAAQEAGRKVPEELSIVGYDDLDIGPFLSPPLTTVAQNLAEVGRRCLAHLLDLIEGTSTTRAPGPRGQLIRPELILRSSTAPPPSGLEA